MRLSRCKCFVAKDFFGGYAAFVIPMGHTLPFEPLRIGSNGEHVTMSASGHYAKGSTRQGVIDALGVLGIKPLTKLQVKKEMKRMREKEMKRWGDTAISRAMRNKR